MHWCMSTLQNSICVRIHVEDYKVASDLLVKSVEPDNKNTPEGILIRSSSNGGTAVFEICTDNTSPAKLLVLKNTVNDLLTHLGLSYDVLAKYGARH